MPSVDGPIMSHGEGLPLRYVPGGRQQETRPIANPGGRLQTPPRSSYPQVPVQRLSEPAAGAYSGSGLSVQTSFSYAQGAGAIPAPVQPLNSVTAQRYRSTAASDYGPSYGPGISASPVLGQFPGSSLMASESNSDIGSGPSSHRRSASEFARHSSSSLQDWDIPAQTSPEQYFFEGDVSGSPTSSEFHGEPGGRRQTSGTYKHPGKSYGQRRPSNRDEFDGPHQMLDKPSPDTVAAQDRELPHLPTNLFVQEQDDILSQVNERLSLCAFHFVAKYQFPIPLEPDKRPVNTPADREWTEWVYLLKRLATKRRIPARILYNGQIKQLVTVLENSMEMRHAAKHQSRPLKDDRNVLQLISAGIQVTKILKDASAMEFMDRLYVQTENLIQSRKNAQLMPPNRANLPVMPSLGTK